MLLKEKHRFNFLAAFIFFKNRKYIDSMFFAMFFLFIFSPCFAAIQDVEHVYNQGNLTIVYSESDTNKVTISEGKFTAIEGKTIRLLPGTHIKASEDQVVNICSKAEQEQLAKETIQRKEKEMLTKAGEKRNEATLPLNVDEAFSYCHYAQLPPEPASVGEQTLKLVASLSSSNTQVSAPVSFIDKKRTSNISINVFSSSVGKGYAPVYQWGERAETIKILRC